MDLLARARRQLVPVLVSCNIVFALMVVGGIAGIWQRNQPAVTVVFHPPTPKFSAKSVAIPSVGYPIRLKIPKITIDAPIDYIRLTAKGELAAPTVPTNVGWYDLGPKPGDKGNAVIDGHFGWKNDIPAVFDDLNKLEAGDIIYIVDEQGREKTFAVTKLVTYHPQDDAADVFKSTDGKAHLNLITCQGAWNQAQKSYSSRLVVFTDQQ